MPDHPQPFPPDRSGQYFIFVDYVEPRWDSRRCTCRPIYQVPTEHRANELLQVLHADDSIKQYRARFYTKSGNELGRSKAISIERAIDELKASFDYPLESTPEMEFYELTNDINGRLGPEEPSAIDDRPSETGASINWREVRDRLERLRTQGEPYTSQSELAKRLGCSQSTVHKAIQNSPKLKTWMGKARQPRATDLNEIITDNTPQTVEADPANVLSDDEVDAAMAMLIGEAKPEERATLNELDTDSRRKLAQTYYAQKRDDEPSPLADDPPDQPRRVHHFKQA